MKKSSEEAPAPAPVVGCVEAGRAKKAAEVKVLDLRAVAGFTDYFVLMTGSNPRQTQAIADEVIGRLKQQGVRPHSVEGYGQGEWVLIDCSDFVVHVFSPLKREFYDLERLWRDAVLVEVPEAAA